MTDIAQRIKAKMKEAAIAYNTFIVEHDLNRPLNDVGEEAA